MKQIIITAVLLICSILTFAQIDSNYNFKSNFTVNMFGELVSNIQPNMPAGFDAFGKSLNTKLDSVKIYNVNFSYWIYYFYNPNGSLKYTISMEPNYNYTYTKTRYFYNSFGLLERSEAKYWDTPNINTSAIDSLRIDYLYNQDSLLIKKTEIDVVNNIYDSASAIEYQYDNQKNIISIKSYRRKNNVNYLWKYNEEIYYFDNSILDSVYMFDLDIDYTGTVVSRVYYEYNSNNQLINEYMFYGYNSFPSNANFYEYYSYSLLKYKISHTINLYPNNTLSPAYKYYYQYEMNNISISSFSNTSLYNDSIQVPTWKPKYLDSVIFLMNALTSDVVYPYFLKDYKKLFTHQNPPSIYKLYVFDINDQFYLQSSEEYFYSNFTLGVDQKPQENIEVNISPNPFNESFSIKSDKFTKGNFVNVYNIVGELVHSQSVNSNEEVVNLPNIASGVYFIRILSDNNSVLATKKVIKI